MLPRRACAAVVVAARAAAWTLTPEKPFVVARLATRERYVTALDRGGDVWLVSREDVDARTPRYVVLRRRCSASDFHCRERRNIAGREAAPNTGALLDGDGGLVVYGGTWNAFNNFSHGHRGIGLERYGPDPDRPTNVARSLIRGDHPGCVERRPACAGACEYDGKLSAVRYRGTAAERNSERRSPFGLILAASDCGRRPCSNAGANGRLERLAGTILLYARANARAGYGGRALQVAAAPRPDGPFAPFERVRFAEYVEDQQFDTNVYFGAVDRNPVDVDGSLLGLFPIRAARRPSGDLAATTRRRWR